MLPFSVSTPVTRPPDTRKPVTVQSSMKRVPRSVAAFAVAKAATPGFTVASPSNETALRTPSGESSGERSASSSGSSQRTLWSWCRAISRV